jgi:hypothetical protein
MPILKGSASDFTSTVKGSAEVNAAVGGAVARKGGNSNPPRAAGAIAAIVTQSAIAKSSGLQPTQFRVLASTSAPAPAPAPVFETLPTFDSIILNVSNASRDTFVCRYSTTGRLNWARRIGGAGQDEIISISSDSSGNIYVIGNYASTTLTVYNPDNLTTFSSLPGTTIYNDTFIVKYSRSGSPQWARRISGTITDQGFGITADSNGNAYAVIYSDSNPLGFYDTNHTSLVSSVSTSNAVCGFIVKYDTSGTLQWVRRIAGQAAGSRLSICSDSNGNTYIGGVYSSNPVNIIASDNTTISASLSNEGSNDIYLIKYDTLGNIQWVRKIAGIGIDQEPMLSIDSNGNINVSGSYTSNPLNIYNPDNLTIFSSLTNDGGEDAFIVKYNTSGTPQWVRRLGGNGTDRPSTNSTDFDGNVYVGGLLSTSSLTIYGSDNISSIGSLSNTTATNDIFVIKYDKLGSLVWARKIASAGADSIFSMSTDLMGNTYLTGHYVSNTLNIFGENNVSISASLANQGVHDMYVIKYDTLGNVLWATRNSGTALDIGRAISFDLTQGVYVAGVYESSTLTLRSVGV